MKSDVPLAEQTLDGLSPCEAQRWHMLSNLNHLVSCMHLLYCPRGRLVLDQRDESGKTALHLAAGFNEVHYSTVEDSRPGLPAPRKFFVMAAYLSFLPSLCVCVCVWPRFARAARWCSPTVCP